jgi:hypothetical protein
LKNTLRPNTKEIKEQHITQSSAIGRNCRTVENTLRPNVKKGITKRAAHSIPAS